MRVRFKELVGSHTLVRKYPLRNPVALFRLAFLALQVVLKTLEAFWATRRISRSSLVLFYPTGALRRIELIHTRAPRLHHVKVAVILLAAMPVPIATDFSQIPNIQATYPAITKQSAGTIDGVHTDVNSTTFSDKIMVTVTQNGRLAQWV